MGKKIISLEIPDELREKARKEAFLQDKSVSAFIRDVLIDYFIGKETKDE